MKAVRKNEGFQGQKAVVIPRKVLLEQCNSQTLTGLLHITDIGYYPKAKFHYRERPAGAEQNILIHCVAGGGEVSIGDTKHKINTGDFVLIPAKTPHSYKADENEPWTIYWLHFKGEKAPEIVAEIMKSHDGHKGFLSSGRQNVYLFEEMYSYLERGYSTEHLMYSNMLLWHFLAVYGFNNSLNPANKEDGKDSTNQAIDFMNKNLNQSLTIDKIAQEVNLSVSHFSSVFKKKTGYTPIGYFNHLKMQKACQYLLFTDYRIKEIAFELGMDDPYYFSRLFTKVMGTSPQQYKAKRIH